MDAALANAVVVRRPHPSHYQKRRSEKEHGTEDDPSNNVQKPGVKIASSSVWPMRLKLPHLEIHRDVDEAIDWWPRTPPHGLSVGTPQQNG
ncbi:hypothetical protein [Leifsonia poae]|uniref:hypothetical protein n=1 Tax=Leifsonia poae TaxID=110933 RepID=UPI001CC1ADB4|nr:hypothetical protein [Leifsonia poae]